MATGGSDSQTVRVVLLGKTGNGKSTLGNALLAKTSPEDDEDPGGQLGFRVGRGMASETRKSAWDTAVRHGVTLEVTDTPGLCDTYMSDEEVYKELAKSVVVTNPGPNVILFVLRADRRFTKEEYEAYQTIQKLFSRKMEKFLIIVFNGIDEFGFNKTIAEQRGVLKAQIHTMTTPPAQGNPSENALVLSNMLREAGGRYIGINNRTTPEQHQAQIDELLTMMQTLIAQNGGAVYQTELTSQILTRAEQMTQRQAAPTPPTTTSTTSSTQSATNSGRRGAPCRSKADFNRSVMMESLPCVFFQALVEVVCCAFQTVKHCVKELCSVM